MIDFNTAIEFHHILINKFGGSNGLRDKGALEAALNRPFATFDGIDLYPEPLDKAAALFESMIINHPFIDGNKRTAYMLMKFLLYTSEIIINAEEESKYQMVISASSGKLSFDEIRAWLQENTNPKFPHSS